LEKNLAKGQKCIRKDTYEKLKDIEEAQNVKKKVKVCSTFEPITSENNVPFNSTTTRNLKI
jgi:hypothetical protein